MICCNEPLLQVWSSKGKGIIYYDAIISPRCSQIGIQHLTTINRHLIKLQITNYDWDVPYNQLSRIRMKRLKR